MTSILLVGAPVKSGATLESLLNPDYHYHQVSSVTELRETVEDQSFAFDLIIMRGGVSAWEFGAIERALIVLGERTRKTIVVSGNDELCQMLEGRVAFVMHPSQASQGHLFAAVERLTST